MKDSICKARMDACLTQQQVADLIGVPIRTVEQWENGECKCAEYQEKLIIEKIRREYFVPFVQDEPGIKQDTIEPIEQFADSEGEFIPIDEVVEMFLKREKYAKEYLEARLSKNLLERGCLLAKKAFNDEYAIEGISSVFNAYLRSMNIIFGDDITFALLSLVQAQVLLPAFDFTGYKENKTAYYCQYNAYRTVYVLRVCPGLKDVQSVLSADLSNLKLKNIKLSKLPEELVSAAKEYFDLNKEI